MSVDYLGRSVEVSIRIGLLIFLAVTCFVILRPFLTLTAWGIVLAIATYPVYRKLQNALNGRAGLAAALWALLLLLILIIPVALLAKTLLEGLHTLTTGLQTGTLHIPPAPPTLETWPIIGAPLKGAWNLASKSSAEVLRKFAPQIKAVIPGLLAASAAFGLTVLQFVLSILLAGVLLANARSCVAVVASLTNRLFGARGSELQQLAGATIRSVTNGILGVAFIQSVFASIGFLVAGIPGAGLWALIFLFAAVLQVGPLVLIPAVIYMFAIASTAKAVAFLVWCIVVGLMDNILKPLLLGRGVTVPTLVVFVGAMGGFIAMGIIGLFAGAIALSLSYRLFLTWLEEPDYRPGNSQLDEDGWSRRGRAA
jgi:predicted PurR-regulated permease PerM